jgi:transcription initiation factor IIF auxiliary subunit
MIEMPYFMTNEDWYEFDFEKRIFVLTEKAPEKAIESYKDYIKTKHPD